MLIAAFLLTGAAYFLFNTEKGQQWLDRLKNSAADQIDQWLADLEEYLESMADDAKATLN